MYDTIPQSAHRPTVNLLSSPLGLRRGPLTVTCPAPTAVPTVATRITATAGADGPTVYDSDWLPSDGIALTPPGLDAALAPGHLYYLTVTLRDARGTETRSVPTPLTVDAPWASTRGIWTPARHGGEIPDFAFFHHAFFMSSDDIEACDRVLLTVTATSPEPARQFVYTMLCNGEEVGVGPCRLGRAPDGTDCLYHQTYDVTHLLRAGDNILAAITYTTAEHAFLCQLTAYDQEGNPTVLTNSARDHARWLTLDGDAVFGRSNSIGTHYFTAHACNIVSPLYPFGFDTPGFDPDARWTPATLGDDLTATRPLLPGAYDPVRRYPADRPVTVTPVSLDTLLVDLGAEIIGGLRLTLENPTDHSVTVTLDYAEQITPEGRDVKSPMNTDNHYRETWTLAPGRQTLETLSLMAFRYVRIVGLPAPLAPADVQGRELRHAFSSTESALLTDHTLLADIWSLTKHTVRVTTQDIYVDSQSRERGAYEGDLLINMLAAYATEAAYAPARLTTEYLLGHRTWPADYLLCIILAAYEDYMATADTRLISEWYDRLRANLFTDCLDDLGDGHALIRSPATGSSTQNAVLVDWPPSERDGYDMAAPYNTVLNALHIRAAEALAAIADALGHTADARALRTLADTLRRTLLALLYDPVADRFRDGLGADGTPSPHAAQHATAYALWAGVYTDCAMASRLADALAPDGKLHVSVYAAHFLLEGLYRAGRGDLATRLLLDPDTTDGARTWAYMLHRMGATVTTEAWNQQNKPNMTLSHPWGATPAHLIRTGICGIIPTAPGYARVHIRPALEGIDHLDATCPTVRGPIRLSWHKAADGTHVLTLVLPAGCEATLALPNGQIEKGLVGRHQRTLQIP